MRKSMIALSLLVALATPAAAQYAGPIDEEIARTLPDSEEIDAIGEAVGRTSDALMDVDVGPVADAMDPARRHYRGDRTLGGLMARNDPYARERIRDDIAIASAQIGAVADQIALMAPALRRSIEESRIRMKQAMRDARYRVRYHEADPYYEGPDDWDR